MNERIGIEKNEGGRCLQGQKNEKPRKKKEEGEKEEEDEDEDEDEKDNNNHDKKRRNTEMGTTRRDDMYCGIGFVWNLGKLDV